MKFLFYLLLFFLFCSCKKDRKTNEEIAKIEISISRFDMEVSKVTPKNFHRLKNKYPYLFPKQYADSIWIKKISDTLHKELLVETLTHFPDFSNEKRGLELMFGNAKYYFPSIKVPKIVTLVSDVEYNHRVILNDTLLLIGLDNYLGENHKFYRSFPRYVSSILKREYIISDVAAKVAERIIPLRKKNETTFLDKIIYFGKQLYLKEIFMPTNTESQIIRYTKEEITWVSEEEEAIWRYFIEKQLLFSTDGELDRRFLDFAPFSKFRLELDRESPDRVGRYIGWQIVKSFMKKNAIGVQEMLNLSAEEIFKKSRYKPRKF